MNTENKGRKIAHHLQVINEKINFHWQLVGFNDIPFLDDYNHVASPPFSLHDNSTSTWQVLMIKTTFPECDHHSSNHYDIESGIDTTLDSNDSEVDLTQDEIRSERSSEDSEVINEHWCENSEIENEYSYEGNKFESEDTIEESSSDDELKPQKKLTASQANLSDEEIKPKRMKKCELKSTASQANLSDEEIEPLNKPNLEFKSDKEMKPLNKLKLKTKTLQVYENNDKTDFDESRDAVSDRESINSVDLKRALGFQIVKVEKSPAWEAINYILILTIGGLKKIVRPKSIPGLAKGEPVDYLYVYESDIGLNLDYVKIINMEACIDYTLLDSCILVKQIVDSKEICEDFNKLLESQSHSDIILVAGDVKIPAHKSILSARSYAFDCMLQGNPQFNKNKLVLDLEKDVGVAMLTFIYAGGIPSEFPLEKCKALSKVADEYEVIGLKETVKKFFINNLDPDVCLQCLGIGKSGLDSIDIPEEQLKDALQKKTCLHKNEIE